jgi:hypothetical protein
MTETGPAESSRRLRVIEIAVLASEAEVTLLCQRLASECGFLDAAGIGLLVDVHRRIWEADGRLTLRGLSARLHRVLHLARVDGVLHTADAPAGYHPRHRGTNRRDVDGATGARGSGPAGDPRRRGPHQAAVAAGR